MTARWRMVCLATAALFVVAGCSNGSGGGGAASDDATTDDAAVISASAGCEGGAGTEGPQELVHEERARTYVVHLPEGYDGTTAAPLLYNLHGLGSNIEQQDAYSAMPDKAGERGYIVVTPQGEDLALSAFEGRPFWNFFVGEGDPELDGSDTASARGLGANDVGFFRELTDLLVEEYCVDLDRVFSTGMSNGAGMSVVLGCELDGAIKAVGPVTGVNLTDVCSGTEPVSVLAIHGDADDVVFYDGNVLVGLEIGNPSVPDRMAQWAEHDGCDAEPVVDDSREGITITEWQDCTGDVEVQLWTLHGWGHRWPLGGSETGPDSFHGSDVILDFFDRVTDRA